MAEARLEPVKEVSPPLLRVVRKGVEERELVVNTSKCAACGICEAACPVGAISVAPPSAVVRKGEDPIDVDES